MENNINIRTKTLCDDLLIKINENLNTLESNYYINKVCMAYSKLISLNEICTLFIYESNAKCSIAEYKINQRLKEVEVINYFKIVNETISSIWFCMNNIDDIRIFFKLFDAYIMPKIYVKNRKSSIEANGEIIFKSYSSSFTNEKLLHDFEFDAMKIKLLRHFSPPQYFVSAIEDVLKYLITYKRTEEMRKIEICLKHQEYLYKDMVLVEKIVSISKILIDENVDGRIKMYVLNSLQMILNEQEKLHNEMGISPTIEHVDLLT